jgi:hypothetical protein
LLILIVYIRHIKLYLMENDMPNMPKTRVVSEEEFSAHALSLEAAEKDARMHRTTHEELRKVERILGAEEGTFANQELYFEDITGECGNKLGWYDHVYTALVDTTHTKELVLSTMLGEHKLLSEPHPMRCSKCARIIDKGGIYLTRPCYASRVYACCMQSSPSPTPRPGLMPGGQCQVQAQVQVQIRGQSQSNNHSKKLYYRATIRELFNFRILKKMAGSGRSNDDVARVS